MATGIFCAILGLLSNLNQEVCSQYICGRKLQEFQLVRDKEQRQGIEHWSLAVLQHVWFDLEGCWELGLVGQGRKWEKEKAWV